MFTCFRKPIRFLTALALTFLFILSSQSQAQYPDNTPPQTILRVDGVAGSANGDGSNWDEDAFLYLQDAIDKAIDPFTDKPVAIWVRGRDAENPNLVYRPDQGDSVAEDVRAESFHMAEQVRIYGGFAGGETGNLTGFLARRPYERITVLSGEINTGSATDNTYHIVTAQDVDDRAIIDGFVIQDGNATGASASITGAEAGAGGGITILGDGASLCEPVILRCSFVNNQATVGGAAYFFIGQNSDPHFFNCKFIGNESSAEGGAVYMHVNHEPTFNEELVGAAPWFINCLFDQNEAGTVGGAAWVSDEDRPTFGNCTIVRNVADGEGGGLYQDATNSCFMDLNGLFIRNTIIYDNVWTGGTTNSELHQIKGIRDVRYSCVKNLTCNSNGNISGSPVFVNSNGDFQLQSTSPCVDAGTSYTHLDEFDLDQNGCTSTDNLTPDLNGKQRVIDTVDMGAYEFGIPSCFADITEDDVVNVNDLLEVINTWGACPAAPALCPADIGGLPCKDNVVNVNDLLEVINNWGACETYTGNERPWGDASSVFDCMDYATSLELEPHSTLWNEVVNMCVDDLCKEEIIECD